MTVPAPVIADSGWPADAIEVGRVLDAWGVKGWIRVQPFAAEPQALLSSRRWFMRPPADTAVPRPGASSSSSALVLKLTQVKAHGDGIVAQVDGIDDRSAAEALRGSRLFVARSSFPTAGPDEYYWVDLLGLEVHNREGELLGHVAGLIDTGPQSVLRVAPREAAPVAEERLIPFVAAYVDSVDIPQRRIVVDWGLDF